jgi:hypothetical protein
MPGSARFCGTVFIVDPLEVTIRKENWEREDAPMFANLLSQKIDSELRNGHGFPCFDARDEAVPVGKSEIIP